MTSDFLPNPGESSSKDFLFFDKNGEKEGFHWLYAVSTDVDGAADATEREEAVNAFLADNGLEHNSSRPELGHVITSPAVKAVRGFE